MTHAGKTGLALTMRCELVSNRLQICCTGMDIDFVKPSRTALTLIAYA